MDEIWKVIPSFPDYEASSLGRVRRSPLRPGNHRAKGDCLRTSLTTRGGYLKVRPYVCGKPHNREVHCLVAEAFHGPRPEGNDVNHIDGNKTNNMPGNLEYVTALRNNHHAYESGLKVRPVGVHNPKAKLTEEQAKMVLTSDLSGPALGKILGVGRSTINMIRRGDTWKHLHP